MRKSNAISLLAVSSCSLFVLWGCNVQLEEDNPAGAGGSELGQVEQHLTVCGSSCPSGSHPTQYSCNYSSCGTSCYGPGNSNQVTCAPNSGTFTTCGSSCPSGWHSTQYSCNYSTCGHSCYGPGNSNQVRCEPNSGTFTTCGSNCPSGWYATQYSCNYSTCGYSCYGPGNSNQVTCTPPCDSRAGTHSQIWIDSVADTQYVYHDGWCGVGTSWPAMCFQGTYYYSQYLVNQYCQSVGSSGSCYDSDAWWKVTCQSLIDCVYTCSGQCVKADC
jgi:hypothetical protein